MDKKQFDEHIKDALAKLNTPYDASSWEKLQHKIEGDPELTEQTENKETFDSQVREKIEGYKAPYNPNHWTLMAEEIRREFTLRGRLMRYKVVEFALMLLFLWTVNQYLPFIQEQVQLHKSDFQKEFIPKTGKEKSGNPATSEKNRPGQKLQNAPQAGLPADNPGEYTLAQDDNQIVEKSTEFSYESAIAENRNKNAEVALPLKSIKPFSGKNTIHISEAGDEGETSRSEVSIDAARLLDLALFNNKKEKFKPLASVIIAAQSGTRVRFSMFSNLGYNYIKTPDDKIYPWLTEYSRYAPGYGGGITFGLQFNKWEIETGGIYASKEYQPRIPTEIIGSLAQGYTEVRFENIQLNMLEVPLNVRYRLGDNGRWRFYGQTGASVHLAMQANYDKFPANLSDILARPSAEGEPKPRLEKKKFPDGLIEGGNFKENSYFTANLGVGVEHLINTRWSLFFQPSVQAYLLPGYNYGLGPNQDRISTISILIGARVTLW